MSAGAAARNGATKKKRVARAMLSQQRRQRCVPCKLLKTCRLALQAASGAALRPRLRPSRAWRRATSVGRRRRRAEPMRAGRRRLGAAQTRRQWPRRRRGACARRVTWATTTGRALAGGTHLSRGCRALRSRRWRRGARRVHRAALLRRLGHRRCSRRRRRAQLPLRLESPQTVAARMHWRRCAMLRARPHAPALLSRRRRCRRHRGAALRQMRRHRPAAAVAAWARER